MKTNTSDSTTPIRVRDTSPATYVKVSVVISLCVCVCMYVGKLIHYMTAHMDAVAGLTIDPHGLYLVSGGMHII